MSRENVEIVRRIYEATSRRDRETVLSLYHPEVEWDMSQHAYGEMFSEQKPRLGRDSVREWFREWYDAFEDFEHACDELIDAGDQVVSVGTDRATGRTSGAAVERRMAGVWTVRDGRVVRVVWYESREQALEAIGRAPGSH
jgi:ketosteroid isomerase-like protein